MQHDGTPKQTNGNAFRRYRVTDSRNPPAAEDRADGILWFHLWSSGAILSGNRPSICRPCQYVQNALDRIPVWHQIRAAVGGRSSAQHRLPMVLRIWTGWHDPKSLHIQQDQNTKMAAEQPISESLLWNSQAMHRQRADRRRSHGCGWKLHSGQRIKRKLDQCRNRSWTEYAKLSRFFGWRAFQSAGL